MVVKDVWTIPFDGEKYLCWETQKGTIFNKVLTLEEDKKVFTSDNIESALRELCN